MELTDKTYTQTHKVFFSPKKPVSSTTQLVEHWHVNLEAARFAGSSPALGIFPPVNPKALIYHTHRDPFHLTWEHVFVYYLVRFAVTPCDDNL